MWCRTRWRVMLLPAPAVLVGLLLGAGPGPDPVPRLGPGTPILFLTIDTLRIDELGRRDAGRDATPFLDELAASGFDFRQCYAQSSWTLPSMLSLFSSLEPVTIGVTTGVAIRRTGDGTPDTLDRQIFAERHVTLTEVLRDHGYSTRGFTTNALLTTAQGFPQGFDTFDETGCLYRPAKCVLDLAAGAIRQAGDAPLFLWVHLFDPHAVKGRAQGSQRHLPGDTPRRRMPIPDYTPPPGYEAMFSEGSLPALADSLRLDYARRVRSMDDAIRSFFGDPDTRSFLDRALIVVAVDHGEEFHERGRWGHGLSLANTLVHTPLLVRLPRGLGLSGPIDEVVRNLDVAPTVLDLLGIPAPAGFHGVSLAPLLVGEAVSVDYVYGETRLGRRDLRYLIDPEHRLKLVLNLRKDRTWLHSLREDPGERTNLSGERPADVDRMKGALMARIRDLEARAETGAGIEVRNDEADPELLEQLEALGYIGP